MKPKNLPRCRSLLSVTAAVLLPSGAKAQSFYWQAPVNEAGRRDGIWGSSVVNWSSNPEGPPNAVWINLGSRIAEFAHPDGGTVAVVGTVRLGGIRAGAGGEYTINSERLFMGPVNTFFDVESTGSGVLRVNSNISGTGQPLSKIGLGTLFIGGTVQVGTFDHQAGTLVLSGNNFSDMTQLKNQAKLVMAGNDKVSSYIQTAGELSGTGTLTTLRGATLNGGTIAGNISGDITCMGDVLVTGNISGGVLDVHDKTMTLEGTSTNTKISISATGSLIVSNGGLDSKAEILSRNDLTINADDTIARLIQSDEGSLSGSGILTVTGNSLISGTLSGNHRGNIQVSGSLVVTGSTGGGTLTIDNYAEAALTGSSSSTLTRVSVGRFGRFSVDGGPESLPDTVTVLNDGEFDFSGDRIISSYTQNGDGISGVLKSSFSDTLTVTNGAIFKGGQINAHLRGNTTIMGTVVAVQGSLGDGKLKVESGSLLLGVRSSNSSVEIAEGAVMDDFGKLDDLADVENAGTLNVNFDDSIGTYTQSTTGLLGGEGILTATGGVTLKGGTISGNLSGITTVTGDVEVSGSIGGGSLVIRGGTLTLTGTSTNESVEILRPGTLKSSGDLDDSADITNHGTLTIDSSDLISSLINNGGTVGGSGRLAASGSVVFNGGSLTGRILGVGGITLNDGTSISGALDGNIRTNGMVDVSGTLGLGALTVASGTLNLTGSANNPYIAISSGATLKNAGDMGNTSIVTNSGTLTILKDDIVGVFDNDGGLVNGSGLLTVTGPATFDGGELAGSVLARSGIALKDGTVVTGMLEGDISTYESVRVSGNLKGGNLWVRSGVLRLTGTAESFTRVGLGAALESNGRLIGDLSNNGTLVMPAQGDRSLEVTGSFTTDGLVVLDLKNANDFDHIKVGGIAAMDGKLLVTNLGKGLVAGEVAQLIEASSYVGGFADFTSVGFNNGVLFDDATGRLIGLAGGTAGSSKTYLNLNESQTQVYLSLYEDAVDADSINVDAPALKSAAAKASGTKDAVELTSGLADGDPQLVEALNFATFTNPGAIYQPVINRLSPEVHRGMADYTEQSLRNHVRQAVDNAPLSRSGDTQVFAEAHSSYAGVDSSTTDAGYDLQMSGMTAGIRQDIQRRGSIGALLGVDDGSIEGGLVDTDASGVAVGVFGSYVLDEKRSTTVNASLSRGVYEFDAQRQSFQGPVMENEIDSHAWELAVGIRTLAYEKHDLRISPYASLRYMNGRVDGFTESGSGVALQVGRQDIESLMLDLGVEAEYKLLDRLTLFGALSYVTDFQDSSENITGSFVASGPLGRQFTVSAPGVDDEAIAISLGLGYDINDSVRVNLNYRGDLRFDSQDAHSIGLGVSFGF